MRNGGQLTGRLTGWPCVVLGALSAAVLKYGDVFAAVSRAGCHGHSGSVVWRREVVEQAVAPRAFSRHGHGKRRHDRATRRFIRQGIYEHEH